MINNVRRFVAQWRSGTATCVMVADSIHTIGRSQKKLSFKSTHRFCINLLWNRLLKPRAMKFGKK